jgi:translation initiation factor IF-3
MDYGKYKYEQKKKTASKKSHSASLKEVKLRPGTDQHDLNFKLNNARKFLMEGDKVKVTVMFRGREMVHTYRGREQLDEVLKQLGPIAKVESNPRMEGRFMSMILVADREGVAEAKRLADQQEKQEKQEQPEKPPAATADNTSEASEASEASGATQDAPDDANEQAVESAGEKTEDASPTVTE